jgi:hypothetical protein
MEIIPSQNLSELTDGKHPSVIPPVYTDGIISSVYTGGITDGEKFFFWKLQRRDDVDFFQTHFRRKYRGIQTRTAKQGRVANTGGITDGFTDGIFRR